MNLTFKSKISLADYLHLRQSADFRDINKKRAKAGLKNSLFIIAAKYNRKTIGMARVIGDGGYIMLIADVMVLPEYQNMGVGTKIMEFLMERIHNSIEDGEGVAVYLMAAEGRENFYKRFGFTARPRDGLGAGMSQWIEDLG